MIVIDPTRTFEFVPPSQADFEEPGILIVRALTVRERQRVYPRLNPSRPEELSQTIWDVLECAVVGWKNFRDSTGGILEFDRSLLDHLDDEYAMGAYEYIIQISQVTPEEAGK